MTKDDLKLKFKYIEDGDNVYKLDGLSDKYSLYIVKDNGWYGLGLEVDLAEADYFEKFENVVIISKLKVFMDSSTHKLMEIITDKKELFNEFAIICMDFIEYIQDDFSRNSFIENPDVWLNKWKDLLGNTLKTEENYAFLAELMSINHLLNQNMIVKYDDHGTHDIETERDSYEIKSTISRYGYEIHINGQHQLEMSSNKNLYLWFIRMEKSLEGCSINDLINEIKKKESFDIHYIEERAKRISTHSLNEKYKVLESRSFLVDDKFPRITQNSFKEGKLPDSITKIDYVVDLSGIVCTNIDL